MDHESSSALVTLVLAIVLAGGCDLPRDPQSTTQTARGGVLRVGVVRESPWTTCGSASDGPCGIEIDLVVRLADELNAEIRWFPGGEARLLPALERFELDLVVGGLTDDTPWAGRVGLTRPYLVESSLRPPSSTEREHRHVFAVPPGENAWLLAVETFLQRERAAARSAFRRRAPATADPGGPPS
jgi:polar amino acid transport system substrate-binding protein